ncbi:hypothetical protein ACFE04_028264 [Oxalis oulophora]
MRWVISLFKENHMIVNDMLRLIRFMIYLAYICCSISAQSGECRYLKSCFISGCLQTQCYIYKYRKNKNTKTFGLRQRGYILVENKLLQSTPTVLPPLHGGDNPKASSVSRRHQLKSRKQ